MPQYQNVPESKHELKEHVKLPLYFWEDSSWDLSFEFTE